MPTKITFVFDNPTDADAFEGSYPSLLAAAKALPGVTRTEAAKVWPKEDGSETPFYRLLDVYFDDYDSASAAVATAEAGELFPQVFGAASGGVRISFADIEA